MDFGLVLQTDPPASRVVSLMKRAERNGFTYGWTFDSAVLWQEPFVIYSQILANTRRLRVGPMVTNPGTRTWEVTASTFATLNDMFGNRTVCGIGRGDSAMRVAGRKPGTLARLGEAIDVIRDLAEGREAVVDGRTLRIPWIRNGSLPVWMAAYGPKALALAGRKADGFILQLADPFLTEWMIRAVRTAAEEAGRDPASVTICVAAPAYVGDDLAHARDQCRWFGGMVGNHVADLVSRYGEHSGLVRRPSPRTSRPARATTTAITAGPGTLHGLRPRRDRGPLLPAGPAGRARREAEGAAGPGRRPVRGVRHARRAGGHDRGVRRRDHPGRRRLTGGGAPGADGHRGLPRGRRYQRTGSRSGMRFMNPVRHTSCSTGTARSRRGMRSSRTRSAVSACFLPRAVAGQ